MVSKSQKMWKSVGDKIARLEAANAELVVALEMLLDDYQDGMDGTFTDGHSSVIHARAALANAEKE